MNQPLEDAPRAQSPAPASDVPHAGEPAVAPAADEPAKEETAAQETATQEAASPAQGAGARDAGMSAAECATLLRQHFPALFGGKPRPLKLRIQADIQQRAPGLFPKQALGAFLRRYTSSDAYLRAMTQETHRYDLDGQPAGEISAEHKEVARQALAQRRAREDARRAQERAERQFRAGLLRDFETTTLTRENFCALKGIAVDQLDAQLEIARREREERRQFLDQLVQDFRTSGKRLPDFAAERGLHPAQLDRLLREAGWRTGPRPGAGREAPAERVRASEKRSPHGRGGAQGPAAREARPSPGRPKRP